MNLVKHEFEPVYNENSKVLILGTIPSPKSREYGFYYSHPQNRFWKVMSSVLDTEVPIGKENKKAFLLNNGIAVWDVLRSCNITGAKDNSIKNPVVNDIASILNKTNITTIFTTGKKATVLYEKYCSHLTNVPSIYLPSTSPANCANYSFDDLVTEYSIIKNYL